ncbi:helix-turn-helix transcriptional regulator [Paenibacillus sp. SC116]|uniref:response regulator transcription factor n=1 Tax=Paenibacillus sp. SC116 TaxID=2968986 RepID=UPI00215B01E1|nr:helix-turn-helix transcriptional regulator [Paenibacillus sp. SC116]MCR8842735.1 helix-turn-helix transcriptional regulator [Paenibacillus sp. SC116]
MSVCLTQKEKEVAILIAKGLKDVEISKKLFVSRRRVGEIIASIKGKCQISSRVQIGILAYHFGWLDKLDFNQSNHSEGEHDSYEKENPVY